DLLPVRMPAADQAADHRGDEDRGDRAQRHEERGPGVLAGVLVDGVRPRAGRDHDPAPDEHPAAGALRGAAALHVDAVDLPPGDRVRGAVRWWREVLLQLVEPGLRDAARLALEAPESALEAEQIPAFDDALQVFQLTRGRHTSRRRDRRRLP